MTYAKLHGAVLTSSIMDEAIHVRWLFLGVMLPLANRDGVVEASLPGLAHVARLTVQETEEALARLAAPDPHSRTKDHEGRRIVAADGGWLILNYEHYASKDSIEDRREKDAARQRRKYQRDAKANASREPHAASATLHKLTTSDNAYAHAQIKQKKSARSRASSSVARPDDVPEQAWNDWLDGRGKPVTETALTVARREAEAAGLTLAAAIEMAAANGWQGFRAKYVESRGGGKGRGSSMPKSHPVGSYGEAVQDL